MKRTMRRIVWFCFSTALALAVCAGHWLWHETHTRIPNTQNTRNFGEISLSAVNFRNRNYRWPESLEELKPFPTLCQDARSGEPYLWVANDHLYANTADAAAVEEKRVLMMLPHTFRSKPWPFGRIETIVLLEDMSVTYLPPSAIRKGEPARTADKPDPIAWHYPLHRTWSPKRIFSDPKVIRLCYAIADQDYELVEQLVKTEGVDINTRGLRDITPLLWAFPLGRAESRHRWASLQRRPEDAFLEQVKQIEREVLSKHGAFLERLLKLGADPNVILQETEHSEIPGDVKGLEVPFSMFPPEPGYSVTHLAAILYGPTAFNYFPIVMANGGDPNLIDKTTDRTPTSIVCGGHAELIGSPKPSPVNLALAIEAQADLECATKSGDTPILLAAQGIQRFCLVYMLIHAGADYRATNIEGKGLVDFVRHYRRLIDRPPIYLREIDPYFFEVVRFLEQEQMLPSGTGQQWQAEVDELVRESDQLVHGERCPFVDQWVGSRPRQPTRKPVDD